MYCPKCREESRPGFTECNDCGVALVTELPAHPHSSMWDVDQVTLVESDNMVMIALAKKSLDHARISYEMHSANADGMWGKIESEGSYGRGSVQIKVFRKDAKAAVALMKKLEIKTHDDF